MIVSEIDKKHYLFLRENINKLIFSLKFEFDKKNIIVLDIAPEIHKGVKGTFKDAIVKTLDLNPESGADYIADLCKNNQELIPNDYFDLIVCTEVLEHTKNPFFAVQEIFRMLKPGGTVAVTTPFNFRIHGPLPDNWRFTIRGLKELFINFANVDIQALEDSNRNLMPIQYTLLAKKL